MGSLRKLFLICEFSGAFGRRGRRLRPCSAGGGRVLQPWNGSWMMGLQRLLSGGARSWFVEMLQVIRMARPLGSIAGRPGLGPPEGANAAETPEPA